MEVDPVMESSVPLMIAIPMVPHPSTQIVGLLRGMTVLGLLLAWLLFVWESGELKE